MMECIRIGLERQFWDAVRAVWDWARHERKICPVSWPVWSIQAIPILARIPYACHNPHLPHTPRSRASSIFMDDGWVEQATSAQVLISRVPAGFLDVANFNLCMVAAGLMRYFIARY
jgi:hypothetical protein